MTIAGILRKHGHAHPRFVRSNGLVSFGALGGHTGEFAVRPHTFHGGEEHQPTETPTAPWWKLPDALKQDRLQMGQFFPDFTELPPEDGQPPAWYGYIDTGRGKFPILICHKVDHSLPSVIPWKISQRQRNQGRRTVKSPHLYTNGNLCVASQEDWDPERDSLATVVAWTAHWHACYAEWFVSGIWPTEGLLEDVA